MEAFKDPGGRSLVNDYNIFDNNAVCKTASATTNNWSVKSLHVFRDATYLEPNIALDQTWTGSTAVSSCTASISSPWPVSSPSTPARWSATYCPTTSPGSD